MSVSSVSSNQSLNQLEQQDCLNALKDLENELLLLEKGVKNVEALQKEISLIHEKIENILNDRQYLEQNPNNTLSNSQMQEVMSSMSNPLGSLTQ